MGTTASKHPATQVREDCFVCKERFSDLTVNPGRAIREEHHVFPQASGGTDGPTVSVCLHHHDLLHKIATRMQADKEYGDLIRTEPRNNLQPLLYLADCAARAQVMMANDPNKLVKVQLVLGARHRQMLDKLKHTLPGKSKSRDAVFLMALELLYQKQFPLKRK